MARLTPNQLAQATRLQKAGRTLREIAVQLGVDYEQVCLGLYGDNADWTPVLGTARLEAPRSGQEANRLEGVAPWAQAGGPPAPPLYYPPHVEHARRKAADASPIPPAADAPPAAQPATLAEGVDHRNEGGGAGASPSPLSREVHDDAPPPEPLPAGDHGRHVAADADDRRRHPGPPAAPERAADRIDRIDPAEAKEADPGGAEAAPPPVPRLYRLKNEIGEYLHKSGHGMTRAMAQAWQGDARQMEHAFKAKPHLKELDPERVP